MSYFSTGKCSTAPETVSGVRRALQELAILVELIEIAAGKKNLLRLAPIAR